MKKTIALLILGLAATIVSAQNKAEIIVSYDYTAPSSSGKTYTTKMSLLASPTEAKYFNDLSLWVDSLKSTPEGKAQYMEILKKACMTVEPDGSTSWDLRKGPSKSVYTYVFTDLSDELLTFYGKFGEDMGYYTEPLSEMEWTVKEDSTANVLGYECILAECDYHGRHWKAWFSPEIPMPFGPWKLHGVPGLILKAEADGGFTFTATGLEQTDRIITSMYLQEDYTKTDRKKAQENAEYFANNEENIMKAQGQHVKIYALDEDGNQIEVPKYDGLKHSLEPDYKMK